jgi:RNA polymerase sigma factor (sigma-70 family)
MMTATDSADLLPTRRSLLTKLKSRDDNDAWREFFETYWRLIYDVARKAGLDDAEAQEAVQETVISVAAEMPHFRYDPARGSFKRWLLTITRRRIADQMRKRYRARMVNRLDPADTSVEREISLADESNVAPDAVWDEEWKRHLLDAAIARVRTKVNPEQFQIFELNVIKGWKGPQVTKTLGVSLMQVYLAKHRVGALLKKEVARLEREMI